MSGQEQGGWEPDPKKMGNWRAMFEASRGVSKPTAATPVRPQLDEAEVSEAEHDPRQYRPWTLQRGRSRPVMMLHLRRFEARSGLWMGWAMSYPNLLAVEYVGDRMVSLDFGSRQFVIQGAGLEQLIVPLQQGTVLALYEHSASVWAQTPFEPVISSIRRVSVEERRTQSDA